jgi:hypothetical protein
MVVQMDLIFDAVFKHEPEKFFRKYYHIMTTDHVEKYYNRWLDLLIDKYSRYKHSGYTREESEAFALADGLEALMDGYKRRKFQQKD